MHGRQGCLVECVQMEPSVGKGLWMHQTQPDVAHRYRAHRTHRRQSPSQDATLRYGANRLKRVPVVLQNVMLYVIRARLFNKAKIISGGQLFKS